MKYRASKIALAVLRGLIYVKRGLVWVGRRFLRLFFRIDALYQRTVGLGLYKHVYKARKWLDTFRTHKEGRFVEFFGKRGTLQLIALLVGVATMVPHTQLYTREVNDIAGRDTLLYQVVGPGDQDFELDEVVVSSGAHPTAPTDAPSWRQGAVQADESVMAAQGAAPAPTALTHVSVGGSAVTKPWLAPGASELQAAADVVDDEDQPRVDTSTTNERRIVQYQVRPGDTLGAIAERHGVSVATLVETNDLSSGSATIHPGERLTILPTDGVVHTVKRGETIGRIAQMYDVSTAEVVSYNSLSAGGAQIQIGQEVIVPGGRRPQPQRTTVARAQTTPEKKREPSNALRQVAAPPPSADAGSASYIWPTGATIITQYYGWRHTGVDIAAKTGTPNYAARDGRVIKSQCGWNGGYGCYVILDHGGGINTLYAHNSKLLVSVGEQVSQGQTIGLIGNTGRSTGPHIHFEVRVGGQRVNPLKYVRLR